MFRTDTDNYSKEREYSRAFRARVDAMGISTRTGVAPNGATTTRSTPRIPTMRAPKIPIAVQQEYPETPALFKDLARENYFTVQEPSLASLTTVWFLASQCQPQLHLLSPERSKESRSVLLKINGAIVTGYLVERKNEKHPNKTELMWALDTHNNKTLNFIPYVMVQQWAFIPL